MEILMKYKKIVWLFVMLLVVTGVFTYSQIPKRDIPEIEQNLATVTTAYPGANPEILEEVITNPIEEEILDIEGVEKVTSTSTNGISNITMALEDGVDQEAVYAKIRQSVEAGQKNFPEEAASPEVTTDIVTSSVATYHFLSDHREDLFAIRKQIEEWQSALGNINGVASVTTKGLPDQKVTISLDQEALLDEQIQPNQVMESIQNELGPTALGLERNKEQNLLLNIKTINEFSQLEDIHIAEGVYLKDLASVSVENEKLTDMISYDEQAAISLTVFSKDGVNITELQERIDDKVDGLKEDLPTEVTAERFYSQSTVINEVYSSLLSSFSLSLLAVMIVMVLGLPLSSAILVALAIPISIIIGLIPLPYAGVDLNQISIIGLIIAIGILVDDAIVANDNIIRRYQLGDPPLKGVKRGIKEVGLSIVTSTLLIVFSFFPLTFLSGANGDFIRALPIALMGTIIASTLIALTVIPTVQYTRQLKRYRTKKRQVGLLKNLFRSIEDAYAERLLPVILKKPWVTAISGIIVCALLLLLVLKVPFEFFPAADREEVTLSYTLEEGTPIDTTDTHLAEIETYIQNSTENIKETARYTGGGLPNIFNSSLARSGENTGQIVLRVDREYTSAGEYINRYQEELREKFPDGEIFLETIVSGPPPSPEIELKISGNDLDILLEKATKLQSDLNMLDSVDIARSNSGTSQPVKTYEIDRGFLAEHGIPINQVKGMLQFANAGVPISEVNADNRRLPVELKVDEGNEDSINLSELTAAVPTDEGIPELYAYDEFITTHTSEQFAAIPHEGGKRTITVEVYDSGKGNFAGETAEIIDSMEEELDQLEENYSLTGEGEASQENDFFIEVAKLFVIVLFLIYITLAVQFNSLLTPVLITSTVFLAITGAVVGLFVSGEPLSFLAVLGIVSLSGVVVRNSILLVEFIEQNKAHYEGNVGEAIIAAGRARIRPIILTALTSIAALTPIIFTGDVLFKPLAISIVSGLIFSTILTLLLLPAFYLSMDKIRTRKQV